MKKRFTWRDSFHSFDNLTRLLLKCRFPFGTQQVLLSSNAKLSSLRSQIMLNQMPLFFWVVALWGKDVSTYPVGILWRKRETSWPSTRTIDTQLTGCSRVSSDLDPRVKDGTWGALNTGASDEGPSQDAHLRTLIMCPLVESLWGKRGCAIFQLISDSLLSSTFLLFLQRKTMLDMTSGMITISWDHPRLSSSAKKHKIA